MDFILELVPPKWMVPSRAAFPWTPPPACCFRIPRECSELLLKGKPRNTGVRWHSGDFASSSPRHQDGLIVCSTQKVDQRRISSLFFPFTSSPPHLGNLDAQAPAHRASDDGLQHSAPRPKSLPDLCRFSVA